MGRKFNGNAKSSSGAVVVDERRIDPADGQQLTLSELHKKYQNKYNKVQIKMYWANDCALPATEPAPKEKAKLPASKSKQVRQATETKPIAISPAKYPKKEAKPSSTSEDSEPSDSEDMPTGVIHGDAEVHEANDEFCDADCDAEGFDSCDEEVKSPSKQLERAPEVEPEEVEEAPEPEKVEGAPAAEPAFEKPVSAPQEEVKPEQIEEAPESEKVEEAPVAEPIEEAPESEKVEEAPVAEPSAISFEKPPPAPQEDVKAEQVEKAPEPEVVEEAPVAERNVASTFEKPMPAPREEEEEESLPASQPEIAAPASPEKVTEPHVRNIASPQRCGDSLDATKKKTFEASSTGSESQIVTVAFSIPYETFPGEEIRVVGNVSKLGQWDPSGAATMQWTDGHVWVAEVELEFPPAALAVPIEYKYVVMSYGQVSRWEQGENRRLSQPQSGSSLVCQNVWDDVNGEVFAVVQL